MDLSEIASLVTASGLLEQKDLVQLFSYCAIPDEKLRAALPSPPFPITSREGSGWGWDTKKKRYQRYFK